MPLSADYGNHQVKTRSQGYQAFGCLKWLGLIALVTLIVYLAATKRPNGYHFTLINYSGHPLKDVTLELPWGEYSIKGLVEMHPTETWKRHRVLYRPFWMGDGPVSVSATTDLGVKLERQTKTVYFQGANDNCTLVEVIFQEGGGITIEEQHVWW